MLGFFKKKRYNKNILFYQTKNIIEYGYIESVLKAHNLDFSFEIVEGRALVFVSMDKDIKTLMVESHDIEFNFQECKKTWLGNYVKQFSDEVIKELKLECL